MTSRDSPENGADAEAAVAQKYNLDIDHSPDWQDCIHPRTGAKYQVKSCQKERSSGRKGRFRLWKRAHDALLRADRNGTAWYVFVLMDGDTVLDMRRMRPATVSKHASWGPAGHTKRPGDKQAKVAFDDIL